MLRISELGQYRPADSVNQYATEPELRRAGLRPSLLPSDLIPMGLKTSWVNPGEAVLREEGRILPLTPLGPEESDVYPSTPRAPYDITNTDYEDRIPRIQHRGDQIFRSRSGVRGPGEYWAYGGMAALGQPEEVPVMFYKDPSEVAYQTYPGPTLGQDWARAFSPGSIWQLLVGGAILGTSFAVRNERAKTILLSMGAVVAGAGIASIVREFAK